jgi:lipoprotein-anchoring transpeptidase ErfK/SrfK
MRAFLLVAVAAASLQAHAHAAQTPKALTPAERQALDVQVMLDRAGFSPGEIDASMGANTRRALDAFTKSGGTATPAPDQTLANYAINAQDTAGPFTPDIPADLMQQAQLPALGYRNIVEELAERFHLSPGLLKRLNPRATFAAGEQIAVPNVGNPAQPVAPLRGSQRPDAANPAAITVTVSRARSALTIADEAGHLLFFAPVTTGSEHDPLPIGEWKIKGVQRDPVFHYNPELFWDAESTHSKAAIAAGPNNPVGVVWIDITRPHYGLHGTPEPGSIGRTESHGCVRLTNWDAMKVALLVRPGTRVLFTP